MCKELNLIQTDLGIWKLKDWTISICSTQLSGLNGIYCIKNLINNKVLIGEGCLGGHNSRLRRHVLGKTDNNQWNKDIEKYGKDCFRLIWIILEENEIQRKLIENKLQLHFKDNCYNTPRRQYPSQQELLDSDIVNRLNNYTMIQRVNGFDRCWETLYYNKNYGMVSFKGKDYYHHVLMYILYYGNICGISSTIHHKCENKKCVNPFHLENITNIGNIHNYHKIDKTYNINAKNFDFNGIVFRKTYKVYEAKYKSNAYIYLGVYQNPILAAQNRDYYIVKNNLLDKKRAKLNFHNIDYTNFTPHLMNNGKINKELL